jgi:hypothetical protein
LVSMYGILLLTTIKIVCSAGASVTQSNMCHVCNIFATEI